MKLTRFLPGDGVRSVFVGRDEILGEVLAQEFPGKPVFSMIQTHGNEALLIDEEFVEKAGFGGGFQGEMIWVEEVDALFTSLKDVVLVVRVADCCPVVLAHPSGVIGVIHAGRVGLEKKIVEKTLRQVVAQTKLNEGWQIWLGPMICEKCYQIDRLTDKHYDLGAEVTRQLTSVLNPLNNFALNSNFCTAHDNDWFYSYRVDGVGTPMNYAIVAMENILTK